MRTHARTKTTKDSSKIATSSAPSRIHIHASSNDSEVGNHPLWRGERDEELPTCSFQDEDGVVEMAEINSRFEHVLDKAPSDSVANLLLKKTKDGYKAFFRIRSAQNGFAGFIRGRRLSETIDKVLNEVRNQIDDWKQNRRLADEAV